MWGHFQCFVKAQRHAGPVSVGQVNHARRSQEWRLRVLKHCLVQFLLSQMIPQKCGAHLLLGSHVRRKYGLGCLCGSVRVLGLTGSGELETLETRKTRRGGVAVGVVLVVSPFRVPLKFVMMLWCNNLFHFGGRGL